MKYKLHLSINAIHEYYDYEVEADTPEQAAEIALADDNIGVRDFTNDKADYIWETLKVDEVEALEETVPPTSDRAIEVFMGLVAAIGGTHEWRSLNGPCWPRIGHAENPR